MGRSNLGAYHTHSTNSGDLINVLFDPTPRIIHGHPSNATDAQMKANLDPDDRLTAKEAPIPSKVLTGLTVDTKFIHFSSLSDPVPIIRNEEVILIRAEARMFNGGWPGDNVGALADLNLVRQGSGGLDPITQATWDGMTETQQVDAVLYERRFSLLFEGGHRWIDWRRLNRLDQIARAVAALPFDDLIVDGEVVVLDEEDGRPSFQRLQQRGRLSRPAEIKRAAVEHPATLYLFDLLALEGYDLRALPLVKRKAVLERILPATGPLRYSEHFEKRGEDLFDHVERMQLEGIVAKKADSKYRAGRSPSWLKIRSDRTDDFVVVGFTRPRESRTSAGSSGTPAGPGAALTRGSSRTLRRCSKASGVPTLPAPAPFRRGQVTSG